MQSLQNWTCPCVPQKIKQLPYFISIRQLEIPWRFAVAKIISCSKLTSNTVEDEHLLLGIWTENSSSVTMFVVGSANFTDWKLKWTHQILQTGPLELHTGVYIVIHTVGVYWANSATYRTAALKHWSTSFSHFISECIMGRREEWLYYLLLYLSQTKNILHWLCLPQQLSEGNYSNTTRESSEVRCFWVFLWNRERCMYDLHNMSVWGRCANK